MIRFSPIVASSLGGVIGLSVALLLASDRTYTASITLPVESGFLIEEMSRDLNSKIRNSGNDIFVRSDGQRLVFQTKEPLDVTDVVLSEVWSGARETLLQRVDEKRHIVDLLKNECLTTEGCFVTRDLRSLNQEAEMILDDREVPIELLPSLSWNQVGNAPDNPTMLAIGSGAGVGIGWAFWWAIVGRRAALKSGDVDS